MSETIDSILFNGNNVVEVSAFLGSTHFEFDGVNFILPAPSGDTVIKPGMLVDRLYGDVIKASEPLFDLHLKHVENEIKSHKRGKKK